VQYYVLIQDVFSQCSFGRWTERLVFFGGINLRQAGLDSGAVSGFAGQRIAIRYPDHTAGDVSRPSGQRQPKQQTAQQPPRRATDSSRERGREGHGFCSGGFLRTYSKSGDPALKFAKNMRIDLISSTPLFLRI
jgi:hypothetical protein